MTNISELKTAALGATDTDWRVLWGINVTTPGGKQIAVFDRRSDAEYVAKAKPRAILELLAMLDESRSINADAGKIMAEFAEALGCAADNESIGFAIDALQERAKAMPQHEARNMQRLEEMDADLANKNGIIFEQSKLIEDQKAKLTAGFTEEALKQEERAENAEQELSLARDRIAELEALVTERQARAKRNNAKKRDHIAQLEKELQDMTSSNRNHVIALGSAKQRVTDLATSLLPGISSVEVNSTSWRLYELLTNDGPLNGHQFNNLKSCFYEALKIAMHHPALPVAPGKME